MNEEYSYKEDNSNIDISKAKISYIYIMSCCIKRQLFIRKLDIRTVYVKEIEIFREISLFFYH